jgi:glycosyltransferase involved in cell wall biosynthesis
MKKEICLDVRLGASSGIGTYIRSLISRIKSEYTFRLIGDASILCRYHEFNDCDIIDTQVPIYSVQEQLALPHLIPKCDLFWSPHFNVPLFPIRAKKRLVTIHDVFFLACPKFVGVFKRMYAHIFFNFAVKYSDYVITNSNFTLSEITKYLGKHENKISVIPLGVDRSVFIKDIKTNSLSIPLKYILYVGNLSPHKNIINLLKSLEYLPQDVHIVLAGRQMKWDGWVSEAVKRQERVTICGELSINDLVWLYQNAQMLVHPSFYEGFGLTPLEAMCAGCPVVVSNVASLPEICGDAVCYVDPTCTLSIAKGIHSLWNNEKLKSELKQKGFQRAKLFDWDRCACMHIKTIEKIFKNLY